MPVVAVIVPYVSLSLVLTLLSLGIQSGRTGCVGGPKSDSMNMNGRIVYLYLDELKAIGVHATYGRVCASGDWPKKSKKNNQKLTQWCKIHQVRQNRDIEHHIKKQVPHISKSNFF